LVRTSQVTPPRFPDAGAVPAAGAGDTAVLLVTAVVARMEAGECVVASGMLDTVVALGLAADVTAALVPEAVSPHADSAPPPSNTTPVRSMLTSALRRVIWTGNMGCNIIPPCERPVRSDRLIRVKTGRMCNRARHQRTRSISGSGMDGSGSARPA
jgi:hypothetical protein